MSPHIIPAERWPTYKTGLKFGGCIDCRYGHMWSEYAAGSPSGISHYWPDTDLPPAERHQPGEERFNKKKRALSRAPLRTGTPLWVEPFLASTSSLVKHQPAGRHRSTMLLWCQHRRGSMERGWEDMRKEERMKDEEENLLSHSLHLFLLSSLNCFLGIFIFLFWLFYIEKILSLICIYIILQKTSNQKHEKAEELFWSNKETKGDTPVVLVVHCAFPFNIMLKKIPPPFN